MSICRQSVASAVPAMVAVAAVVLDLASVPAAVVLAAVVRPAVVRAAALEAAATATQVRCRVNVTDPARREATVLRNPRRRPLDSRAELSTGESRTALHTTRVPIRQAFHPR